jgi:hypothetical protein
MPINAAQSHHTRSSIAPNHAVEIGFGPTLCRTKEGQAKIQLDPHVAARFAATRCIARDQHQAASTLALIRLCVPGDGVRRRLGVFDIQPDTCFALMDDFRLRRAHRLRAAAPGDLLSVASAAPAPYRVPSPDRNGIYVI